MVDREVGRCEKCVHWDRGVRMVVGGAGQTAVVDSKGRCRRNPPIVERSIEAERSEGHSVDPSPVVWPVTKEDDWCGEFGELPGGVW